MSTTHSNTNAQTCTSSVSTLDRNGEAQMWTHNAISGGHAGHGTEAVVKNEFQYPNGEDGAHKTAPQLPKKLNSSISSTSAGPNAWSGETVVTGARASTTEKTSFTPSFVETPPTRLDNVWSSIDGIYVTHQSPHKQQLKYNTVLSEHVGEEPTQSSPLLRVVSPGADVNTTNTRTPFQNAPPHPHKFSSNHFR